MIIDFHTHIFPDKIAVPSIEFLSAKSGVKNNIDGTAAGLAKSMEQSGVDMSVVLPVATKPKQFDSITRFACEINEKYVSRSYRFGIWSDYFYQNRVKSMIIIGFDKYGRLLLHDKEGVEIVCDVKELQFFPPSC